MKRHPHLWLPLILKVAWQAVNRPLQNLRFVRTRCEILLKDVEGDVSLFTKMSVFIGLAVAANGQELVTQRNLSLPIAKTIAEAALAACKEKGYRTAVAVVDRAGQLMVILRDEQASAVTIEMAQRKAYTARMFGSTLEFQKRTSEPNYAAQRDVTNILALGGGVPIRVGRETIGGVASSGAGQGEDDACAKAGIAKVAELLK